MIDQHFDHFAIGRRKDLPPHLRSQSSLCFERKVLLDKHQPQDDRGCQSNCCNRLGQRAGTQYPSGSPQGTPQRHQEQVAVGHRIGDRPRAVLVHQIAAGVKNLWRDVAFDLFDNQRTDHFATVRVVAIDHSGSTRFLVGAQLSLGSAERQDRNVPPVRLVDVIFERLFDLWRQVFGRSVVPQWFARGHHSRGQIIQRRDNVGSVLDRVLAADRLHPTLATLLDRHTHPVATNQPTTFIGHDVGGFFQIQRFVRGTREGVGLLPQGLTITERAKLLTPQPLGG